MLYYSVTHENIKLWCQIYDSTRWMDYLVLCTKLFHAQCSTESFKPHIPNFNTLFSFCREVSTPPPKILWRIPVNVRIQYVSWQSGLAHWTKAECGLEPGSWHLSPWARHLTIIASQWVEMVVHSALPVRLLVDNSHAYILTKCNRGKPVSSDVRWYLIHNILKLDGVHCATSRQICIQNQKNCYNIFRFHMIANSLI